MGTSMNMKMCTTLEMVITGKAMFFSNSYNYSPIFRLTIANNGYLSLPIFVSGIDQKKIMSMTMKRFLEMKHMSLTTWIQRKARYYANNLTINFDYYKNTCWGEVRIPYIYDF